MNSKPRTVFSGTSGLHTRVDPFRARVDHRTNIRALTRSVNCMIDDTGRVDRVPGFSDAYGFPVHSLHGFDDYGLAVSEGSIIYIDADAVVTPIRDVDDQWPMSFCRVDTGGENHDIYYCNGVDQGILKNGSEYRAWEKTPYFGSAETSRVFSDKIPQGHLLAYGHGRMWIARENLLYYSEPYSLGAFDFAHNRIHCSGTVRLIRPADGGLWLGDATGIYWLDGSINPWAGELPRKRRVATFAALWGQVAPVDLDEFPFDGLTGSGWIVPTIEGACLCGPGGFFRNLTGRDVAMQDEAGLPLAAERGGAFAHNGRSFVRICPAAEVAPLPPFVPAEVEGDVGIDFVDRTAAVSVGAFRVVTTRTDGTVEHADHADPTDAARILGVSSAAIAAGLVGRIITEGYLDTSLSFTAGYPIFLGVDGELVQTPVSSGFSIVIGWAITTSQIRVRIETPVLL